VGYGYSYDLQTDTITLLVASREIPERHVGKAPHVPRLYNPPNGVSSSAGRQKTYVHGLLALKLHRTAVVETPIPTPESIILHQESRCNPAFVQSALHMYAAQHWIEGDLVRVRAGELFGCTAKIHCVDMGNRSASAHMEDSVDIEKVSHGLLMFSISDLERKFRVGDNVRVLDNSAAALELKGKTGMVVQVDDDTVGVVDQSSNLKVSDLSIFISSLMFSSLKFTVAIDSLATFIGDISKQAPENLSIDDDFPMKGDHVVVTDGFYGGDFGVVSKVNTRKLAFFSESLHQHIWVPITMTAFNPNPTALRYTRERGYNIVAGDVVQVVRGDPLRASGTVLRVNLDNKTLTFKDMLRKEVSSR
jgi:ribosomal protein L24